MSDERKRNAAVNPHTGRPIPDEPLAAPGPTDGAAAAFQADAENAPGGGARPASEDSGGGTDPHNASAPPSQQEVAIRAALETVLDPEISLSVIDLGLIREIQFLQDPPRTHVRMMLTTPFCPYAPQLVEDVKQAVTSVLPQECEVEILADAWSPDLMPDPGLLGFSF